MKKQVSMRLEDSTLKRLDEIATEQNRTRTNMLECIILSYKK